MILNRQLTSFFFGLIILPNVVFWYSPDELTSNVFFQLILALPVAGSLIMSYLSYNASKTLLLVCSVIVCVLTLLVFFTINSFSSFGFWLIHRLELDRFFHTIYDVCKIESGKKFEKRIVSREKRPCALHSRHRASFLSTSFSYPTTTTNQLQTLPKQQLSIFCLIQKTRLIGGFWVFLTHGARFVIIETWWRKR